MVAVGALFAELFIESPQGKQLLWIARVAISGVLRALARRRWYGIDWLRFGAERETAPFALRRVQPVFSLLGEPPAAQNTRLRWVIWLPCEHNENNYARKRHRFSGGVCFA